MTKLPPSPFISTLAAAMPVETAAAPDFSDHPVAAAEQSRFVLDVEAFMNDIEPLPAFLSAPSQSYLQASDLIPVLETLAGRM